MYVIRFGLVDFVYFISMYIILFKGQLIFILLKQYEKNISDVGLYDGVYFVDSFLKFIFRYQWQEYDNLGLSI